MDIKIKPVTSTLYLKYPGQTDVQRVHVVLDCRDGELTAESDGETGGGMPMAVYDNLIQRWTIPCLKEGPANTLLEEIAPLAERVVAGFEIFFRGSNRVGRFSPDAVEACEAIALLCEGAGADPMDLVQVWDASAFFSGLGSALAQARSLGITAETTDEELSAIGERELANADGVDRIEGMESHLTWVRTKAREACEEAA